MVYIMVSVVDITLLSIGGRIVIDVHGDSSNLIKALMIHVYDRCRCTENNQRDVNFLLQHSFCIHPLRELLHEAFL